MPTSLYTIEVAKRVTDELIEYLAEMAPVVNEMYGSQYDWENFNAYYYVECHRISLCRRKGVIVGCLLSRNAVSPFDGVTRICYQDLLYSIYPKATHLLIKDFIDFGRLTADHIISAIGSKTNIKRASLEKLGYSKLEELYSIEVVHE